MKFLIRDRYLDKLKALNQTPDIKVITGIRRCGKSVLLEEYAEYLTKTEPDVNIVMINLQELDYGEFLRITEYMMDNVSNLVSPNNISDTFHRDNIGITRKTVSKYMEYLEHSFLFYEAKRYDLKGKKYLKSNPKYYLCDTAFRYAVNGTRNMDFGRMYENIVYIELLRRGYEVYVGKLYKKEVDFVAIRQTEKLYIQVSDNISDPSTFEREYSALLAIKDAYPKMILARTRHEKYDYEGIAVCDIARWLGEEA